MNGLNIEAGEYSPSSNRLSLRSFTWRSEDGLTLAGVHWPVSPHSNQLPVLCLPGLSRNTRDFDAIAQHLQQNGVPVYALDYRGRGRSDWDTNWENYTIAVEGTDIDAAISHLQLERFALLGTSRGGLHAMAMAHRYDKTQMPAVILNDIGPDIPLTSLLRIRDSIGHKMMFESWDHLTHHLKTGLGTQFPALDQADWIRFAHQLASEEDGHVVLDYDPALRHQLDGLEDHNIFPNLWPVFDGLKDRRLLILRGQHSDLLSEETLAQMIERHPRTGSLIVPAEGHAPLLWGGPSQQAILHFLRSAMA